MKVKGTPYRVEWEFNEGQWYEGIWWQTNTCAIIWDDSFAVPKDLVAGCVEMLPEYGESKALQMALDKFTSDEGLRDMFWESYREMKGGNGHG